MGLRLPSLQHHAILAINRAMNPLLKRYLKGELFIFNFKKTKAFNNKLNALVFLPPLIIN